jgi:serum/glucocorticoid-regulated kinase 2
MYYSFESGKYVHFVLEFCPGGELFFHMRNMQRLKEEQALFYFCEILLGLEHLHANGIVYRDLKPENILLDLDGHIVLTDFGLSKKDMKRKSRTYSFCGSPEYISPEMLRNEGHGMSVDFYSLGVLLYEMLTGLPPFYDPEHSSMYRKILHEALTIPRWVSES